MRSINTTVKYIVFDLIVIALISLIPLFWIPEGKILTGHDSGYPINVIEAFKNRFFTWNSQDSFGLDNTTSLSVVPVLSLQALSNALGASVADSERITFIFWFVVMQVSMYLFARSLRDAFPSRWFPLLSAVLYVFNFYLLALWRYGAGTTFSAYTALPLVLLYLLGFVRKKRSLLSGGIGVAVTIFLFNGGGGLSLPLFGGLLVAVLFTLLYFYALTPRRERKAYVRNAVRFCLLVGAVSMVLNAYWAIPFFYYVIANYYTELSAKGGKAVVLQWTHSVSIFTSISNLFRLQGYPDWYNNPFHPYANQFIQKKLLIATSMLIAPTAYLPLLFAKNGDNRRMVVYFSILSLLGIFFAAGSHPPTGWLYSLFILYVPGFVVFRSAQYKFISILLLSFSVLIAYAVTYLLGVVKERIALPGRLKQAASYIAVGLVICGILLYHYPFFGKGFFYYNKDLSTLLAVPSYILSYDAWSRDNMDGDGRTLVLPRFNTVWKAALFDWNYFSLYSPLNLITPRPFVQYSYYLNESQLALFNRLAKEIGKRTPLSDRLLAMFQVRHVLLAGDVSYRNPDMPSEPPEQYLDALRKDSRFTPAWQEGPWSVFSRGAYEKNKIYAISSVVSADTSAAETPGVVVYGTDQFILPQVLGKSVANPLERIPVSGTVSALSCVSCKSLAPETEILPPYTGILPGSVFYPVKRWREGSASKTSGTAESRMNHALGISLKRVSEIGGMMVLNAGEPRISPIVNETKQLWDTVRSELARLRDSQTYGDALVAAASYAAGEYKYLHEIALAHPQYGGMLAQLTDQYLAAMSDLAAYRDRSAVRHEYVAPADTSGRFYLDVGTLATGPEGETIVPVRIEASGRTETPAGISSEGVVDIGSRQMKAGETLVLVYPEPENLLSVPLVADVRIDNREQSCQISEVRGFDWERTYRVKLDNIGSFAQSTQVYLRRKKHFDDRFTLEEREVVPNYAFNFDRTLSTAQDAYFSGTDGDVAAYLYLCQTRGEKSVPIASSVSVSMVSRPSVYVHSGERSVPVVPLSYTRVNQAKYTVDLSRATFPMILVFNENYNSQWRLSTADSSGSIQAILTDWRIPSVAEATHMQVNGYANAWYLEKKPADRIVIEFFPQSLFYKGIVFSVTGVIGLVVFLVWKRKSL